MRAGGAEKSLKVKRVQAGVYEFTNKHGATGEILKQPEGGWSIWSPTGDFDEYAPTYRAIKEFAENAKPRGMK